MIRKLKDSGGFSMIEMLCVVFIMVLLCLMTSSGLAMATESYRDVTAESELRLLLNDLSDALADKLRYTIVTETKTTNDDGSITTTRVCLGQNLTGTGSPYTVDAICVYDDMVKWKTGTGGNPEDYKNVLTTGAYGSKYPGDGGAANEKRYKVETAEVTVTYDTTAETSFPLFTIKLKVTDTLGNISMEPPEDITVRCLNPVKKMSEP